MWKPLPLVINSSCLRHIIIPSIWFEQKVKPCIYGQNLKDLFYATMLPSTVRLVVRSEGKEMATHSSVNLVASLIPAGLSSAIFTMRMRPLSLGQGEDESLSLIMVLVVTGGSLQHATLASFYLQLSGEQPCVTANERVRKRGWRNAEEGQTTGEMKMKREG